MTADGLALLERTRQMVEIPSVSHEEKALADHVEQLLLDVGGLEVLRLGDNVVARTHLGRSQRIILAGHLDTVPSSGTPVKLEGDRLTGLGATDMKGGLAVMSWLAEAVPQPAVDITWIFYVAEEVARDHSGLLQIERERPDLLQGDAAILGEPTSAQIEVGCQGTLRVALTLKGRRAHTARPWRGVNAIHRLAPVLAAIATWPGREPVLDGCRYIESLQAVRVEGGVAGNVLPDAATLVINHRFAPDRSAEEALSALGALFAPFMEQQDSLDVVDRVDGAAPNLSHPLLAALADTVPEPPRAKLGWTDVARFAAMGIPAINFGPGDPELAHTAGEWVDAVDLERVGSALLEVVTRSDL